MSNKLLKSSLIVSFFTFLSRVFGLLRDIVIANLLGAGAGSDVFFIANRIPNFLRRIFAEGAFSQAFIPVFNEFQKEKYHQEILDFVACMAGVLGGIITLVTFLGMLLSPLIIIIFSTGWFIDWWFSYSGGEKFLLASFLLKITFPYLWFISLCALFTAILNSLGKFSISAFSPILLNIMIIVCALYISPQLQQPEIGLAIGVFFGGLSQFLLQLSAIYYYGWWVKPRWDRQNIGVKKVFSLMLPAIFGVSVGQVNLLLDSVLASFLIGGSISWLYYADRLIEFPVGIMGVAIATVLLPSLSKNIVSDMSMLVKKEVDFALIVVFALGLPASIGLIMLAKPIIMVLFMHGEFDALDIDYTAYALIAYSLGLVFLMLIKVLVTVFYAHQEVRIPVKIGIQIMILNMLLNLIFIYPLQYLGLALATSISAVIHLILLYYHLSKRYFVVLQRPFVIRLIKVVVANVLLIVFLYFFALKEMETWIAMDFIDAFGDLMFYIVSAICFYFTCLFCLFFVNN